MEQRFYVCEHCGNIVAMVKDSGVPVMCCGQKMKEIIPGTVDAAVEKHVPVYKVEGNLVKVSVGAAEHLMLPEHFIFCATMEQLNSKCGTWIINVEEMILDETALGGLLKHEMVN